ncbi:hypothetical protein DEO72_LG7g1506 [Vigna unguiculata]|uniref:Uncharacterized protein n=1 Tax=Vigna unguiculata TaxID=3917 RepID=A0A4D6MJ61_VIGUN|nr:hypothetical protein DEO72_LG7g1506 [Vigna unguiculata]
MENKDLKKKNEGLKEVVVEEKKAHIGTKAELIRLQQFILFEHTNTSTRCSCRSSSYARRFL